MDESLIESMEKDVAMKEDVSGDNFKMVIGKTTYTNRKDAGLTVVREAKKHFSLSREQEHQFKIGKFAGFDLYVTDGNEVVLKGERSYRVPVNPDSSESTMKSIEARVRGLNESLEKIKKRLETTRKNIAKYEKLIEAPFERAAELEEKRKRNAEIMLILNPPESVAVSDEDDGDDYSIDFDEGESVDVEKDDVEESEDSNLSVEDVDGKSVVYIKQSSLSSRQLDDVKNIAGYLAEHIGEVYTVIESGDSVYIGEDLPNEFVYSKSATSLKQNRPELFRAKGKSIDGLGLLIENATNRRSEDPKHADNKDAKRGMYRYDASFAFSVKNNKGDVVGIKAYDAELVVRRASDGRDYLYDIVNIKKNATATNTLMSRLVDEKPTTRNSSVSEDNIPRPENNSKTNNEEAKGITPHPDQWKTDRIANGQAEFEPLSKLVDDLSHDFETQITTGQIRKGGVRGQFNNKNEGIRTKIANDLPTICHELGHKFDKLYGLSDVEGAARKELVDNLDPDFAAEYTDKKKLPKEGVAEYLRRFLQNRDTAAIDYPEFTKHFMNTLSEDDRIKLELYADKINAYYSLGADSAASTIRLKSEGDHDPRTIDERIGDFSKRLQMHWLNSNFSFRALDEIGGTDIHKKAANAAYVGSMAGNAIDGYIYDFDNNYLGPGLRVSLTGVNVKDNAEYKAFGEYLKCKHGVERLKRGQRVFADDRLNSVRWMENRAKELEEQYPQFAKTAEQLYTYRHNIMEMAVKMGLISQEALDKMEETYEYYVPFYRAIVKKGSGAKGAAGYVNQVDIVRTAYGSGHDTWHPVDNLITLTNAVYHAGVLNRVGAQLAEAAEEYDFDATIMERVPAPVAKRTFRTDDIKRALNESLENAVVDGKVKSPEDIDVLAGVIDGLYDVYYQYQIVSKHGDNSIVRILRNGTPEYWKISDPFLWDTLTHAAPRRANEVFQFLGRITKFITNNLTGLNILWSVFSNGPRDVQTLMSYARTGRLDLMLRGMAQSYIDTFKGDNASDIHKLYMALGGGDTNIYTVDVDSMKRIYRKLMGKPPTILDMLDFVSNMVERSPREAYFRYCIEHLGMTPEEAMYAAHDITVNFAQGGTVSKQLNRIFPFFNASIQSAYKMLRYLSAEDVVGDKKKRAKTAASRTIGWLTVSALIAFLMAALHHKDDETEEAYERLSSYTKNSYYTIPIGEGKFFAIPKARELSIATSFFENLIEMIGSEDKHAFDEFYQYATDNIFPSAVAGIAQGDIYGAVGSAGLVGIVSYMGANRDFLGRPIESAADIKKLPKDRYNGQTSKAAYWVGQGLGLSPKMIDYFFSNMLGGWWKYQKALFPVDSAYQDKTLGIKNTYVKDSAYSTDLVNWLYDKAELSSQESESDPESWDKSLAAKLDGDMTTLYSNFSKAIKNNPESEDSRASRFAVLDMISDYRDACDEGSLTDEQEAVFNACKEIGDTKYLPSVMSSTVTDSKSVEHDLTGLQYYEYATNYNSIYYDLAGKTLGYAKSTKDKEIILSAVKDLAKERATNAVLGKIGGVKFTNYDKYKGVDDTDVIRFKLTLKKNDADGNNNISQEEGVNAIKAMKLSDRQSNILFHSVNKEWAEKNNPWTDDPLINYVQTLPEWGGFNEKQQANLKSVASDISNKTTKGQTYIELIDGGKSAGMTEKVFLQYIAARSKSDKPTEAGNYGSYTNAEIEEAIRSIVGISKETRTYLWVNVAGKNSKKVPRW